MYNANGKNGNRAVIYYNFLASSVPGFDHNIALYDVVDITSKEIVMADNAGSLLTLGDSPVGIDEARISGDWLDICCYYPAQNATSSAENRISLVDNRTVQPPTEMPQGYTYLELRLKTNGETSPLNIRRSCISYRLGEYGSASTGGKGFTSRSCRPTGSRPICNSTTTSRRNRNPQPQQMPPGLSGKGHSERVFAAASYDRRIRSDRTATGNFRMNAPQSRT